MYAGERLGSLTDPDAELNQKRCMDLDPKTFALSLGGKKEQPYTHYPGTGMCMER